MNAYAQIIRERWEENIKDGNAAARYMENSTAIYRGEPVACLYMPKIFSREAYEFLQKAAGEICVILDKVIERYLSDAEYRRLFPFDKELEELILTEAGYPRLLPIARLDIFFDEDDFSFKFCEFNADGASAMNEDREINNAIRNSDAFIEFTRQRELLGFEFFDSWVHEFGDIYSKYNKKVDVPRIAIVDIMENGTIPNEFIEFKKAFERAGYDTKIYDMRDLEYQNGILHQNGLKIDAVYRRAVTCDVIRFKDDVQPFLQAARDNAVCIVGHFRTQIIHNKAVFKILRMSETLSFLSEAEREYVLRHIPETLPLESGKFDLSEVLTNKDAWIIKPEDLYGSRGVFAGVDETPQSWEKAVRDTIDTGYLLQQFCPPYQTENLDFTESPCPQFKMYNNITGLFVYNGKLQGIYSRAGLMGTISPFTRGLTVASLVCCHNKEKFR
ncbi:MAG: glutathionylspermidine synthase family protein [Defluviitaleaceae bacterium]|nr:glutathionylspermidine synthase family protein [Defluviitaleaceae bacterium]